MQYFLRRTSDMKTETFDPKSMMRGPDVRCLGPALFGAIFWIALVFLEVLFFNSVL